MHGYFRTRGELHHNFSLGRREPPGSALGWGGAPYNLWANPLDHSYVDSSGIDRAVLLCPDRQGSRCEDISQASANMRFRMAPELHISDNLRILTQIDALDNLVLGSTPNAFAVQPGGAAGAGPTGFRPALGGFYPPAQLGFFSSTQGPPTAGINSFRNSIDVKRAWGEYATPVGQLRFGRMPFHWGLGMTYNAGDTFDSDWQTTYDRILFASGIKSYDFYFGGSWDFMNTGVTNQNPYDFAGGSPVNLANLTNVGQWMLFAARKRNPEMQKLELSQGNVVVNGGLLGQLRVQALDVIAGETPMSNDFLTPSRNNGLERRNALMVSPNAWIQVLWNKLRIESELNLHLGSIEHTPQISDAQNPVQIRMWGLASQVEYRAIEDKLRLQMGFGYASGDPWVDGLQPAYGSWQRQLNNGRGPISTFRFHPDYRVDLIFFRRMLSSVAGAYYFRPSVDYDFIRNSNGQKLGGGAAVIWSRAAEFIQTPGHQRDLGVEIDVQLYYQAKDGILNDHLDKQGGFFAMLQYGVFFPLGGLQYLPGQKVTTVAQNWDVGAAQTARLFLGIAY